MNLIRGICFILLILTGVNCEKTGSNTGTATPLHGGQVWQTGPNSEGCQFYNTQSLVVKCHKESGFFTEEIGERQNTIASICLKQAFSAVFGVNLNPSLPQQRNDEDSWFRGWLVFGNLQLGDLPPSPPHPLEMRYVNFLNHFGNSINSNQFSTCLEWERFGHFVQKRGLMTGSEIIDTALKMVKHNMLDHEIFVKCYREQLEQYGRQACSAVVAPQNP